MIDINSLRKHFQDDSIVISEHAKNRCRERNIKQKDIKNCIATGEIIEQYPDDLKTRKEPTPWDVQVVKAGQW